MRKSTELQTGKAGEYLVCADLILKNFVAFPSEQGLPYDVVLDVGHRMFRIQVKTTTGPRKIPQRTTDSMAYIFNVKRCGKNGKAKYSDEDIDLFALVCLDTRKIGYISNRDMPETINIRVDSLRGTHRDERGIVNHRDAVKHYSEGVTQTEVARRMGLNVSLISRIVKPNFVPFQTNARYFSDFERDSQWFHDFK